MSWSVSFMGNVDKVVKALEKYSTILSGQSKQEYDTALPHMIGLVKENVQTDGAVVKVDGNGHASFKDGQKVEGYLTVKVERQYVTLV